MLLRELLLAECRDLINKVLHITTLPHNEVSADKIANTLVRSMSVTGEKEPSNSPVYLIADALSAYKKSNTWPPRLTELVDEVCGLTKLSYGTVRSSLATFPWDIPKYLTANKRHSKQSVERVKIVTPVDSTPKPPPVGTECVQDTRVAWQRVEPTKTVKADDNYHVIVDFGAFKITIEKVNHE